MKKLTAREKKILRRPKIRVISETPNEPNRKMRRDAKYKNTSSPIHTKKHTIGRIKINNVLVRKGTKDKPGNGLVTLDLIPRKK